METTYEIRRHYKNHPTEVVERGLTRDEAKAHCNDPDTNSRTCTSAEGQRRTEQFGEWFDGFAAE